MSKLWMVVALPIMVLACADAAPTEEAEPPQTVMLEGSCGEAFGSQICTWAEMEGDEVVRVGANVPLASVEGAPADAEMMWPPPYEALITFPAAATERLGMQSLKVYWEAHGHPPGPYLVPHFDFHVYTVSEAEVDAIDCSDSRKPAAAPAGYVLPDMEIPEIGMLTGLCVPQMGMHALPAVEMEGEDPFAGTMVIGYYGGDPIFYEPMISRATLMERQSFDLDMPTYAAPDGVVLPTAFRAEYDADTEMYRFVFSGFGAAEE